MHLLYVNFTTVIFTTQAMGIERKKLHTFFCLFSCLIGKQEFSEPRDADDAQYNLDGREVDGSRIIVEFAKGVSCWLVIQFLNGCYNCLLFFKHLMK
jgi:hypothetical protein